MNGKVADQNPDPILALVSSFNKYLGTYLPYKVKGKGNFSNFSGNFYFNLFM